jgi:hypothetical protein
VYRSAGVRVGRRGRSDRADGTAFVDARNASVAAFPGLVLPFGDVVFSALDRPRRPR